MQATNRYHYTATGRLGLWNTFERNRQGVVQRLDPLLKQHAGASLEVEGEEIYLSEDPAVVALGTVLDKIVSRGRPTLVDLALEERLVQGAPDLETVSLLEKTNGRLVGPAFDQSVVSGQDLLQAAAEGLYHPYDESLARHQIEQRENLAGSEESVSPAEDEFYDTVGDVISEDVQAKLRRQVPIVDLVGHEQPNLVEGRVDFALEIGPVHWVFEIDGQQHRRRGQSAHDDERDDVLREAGWNVARPSASTVRSNAGKWIEDEWLSRLSDTEIETIIEFGTSPAPEQARALAERTIIRPHVSHRALAGWVHLLRFGVLPIAPSEGTLRMLLLEEDVTGAVDGLDVFLRLWGHMSAIAEEVPIPPEVTAHVLGDVPEESDAETLQVEPVNSTSGEYDLVVSHAFSLYTGEEGQLEADLPQTVRGRLVRMRSTGSHVDDRRLRWSPRLTYDLDDLEEALQTQDTDHPAQWPKEKYEALRFFLQVLFRKNDFWEGQARVIARLLRGESAIVLLPTGGGKSLTYQFSGLLLPGMTLIVDPLVSLMQDQVENLQELAVDCVESISSLKDRSEKERAMDDMAAGKYYFTFVTPERLQMPEFQKRLQTLTADVPVSLAVVDEVHCVSEWGHDFRPSYLLMRKNIEENCTPQGGKPPRPVGLTGTASFSVLTDAQIELDVTDEEGVILPETFDREELTFHVETVRADERQSALTSLRDRLPRVFQKNPQTFFQPRGRDTNSGIVFCPHVNGKLGVVDVAAELGHDNYYCGSQPRSFEGSAEDWRRQKLEMQRAFKHDQIQELVATKSFGMGIDKPNIRYTLHLTIPQSVEGFYQEAGRAGRDGNDAHCFILYSDDNWEVAQQALNETDHRRALELVESVDWRDRGDVLHQLWFLLTTYEDRTEEKERAFSFWKEHLQGAVQDLPLGASNTVEVPFNRSRTDREEALYRLVMLDIVESYVVKWSNRTFEVRVRNRSATDIREALLRYFRRYKVESVADEMVDGLPTSGVDTVLKAALGRMVDFVYDDIVAKRKQALRTMAELCRGFESSEQFRESILTYLQESEFTSVLREWVNQPFENVGLSAVRDVIDRLESLEEAKRLVGTTRRMLDEDPSNVALRVLSVESRLRSEMESNESVRQEYEALLSRLNSISSESCHNIIVHLVNAVSQQRPNLFEGFLNRALASHGSVDLIRTLQKSEKYEEDVLSRSSKAAMMSIIEADVLSTVQSLSLVNASSKSTDILSDGRD